MSNLDAISFSVTPAAYFFPFTYCTNLQYFLGVLHACQLCSRLITLPCNDIRNASLGINIDNTFVVKKLNVSIERFGIPDIKTSHANFTYFKVVPCFRSLKYNPHIACVWICLEWLSEQLWGYTCNASGPMWSVFSKKLQCVRVETQWPITIPVRPVISSEMWISIDINAPECGPFSRHYNTFCLCAIREHC